MVNGEVLEVRRRALRELECLAADLAAFECLGRGDPVELADLRRRVGLRILEVRAALFTAGEASTHYEPPMYLH